MRHPDVPLITLNTSYRLPLTIGGLLSTHVYSKALGVIRVPTADAAYAQALYSGLQAIAGYARWDVERRTLGRMLGGGGGSVVVGSGISCAWLQEDSQRENSSETHSLYNKQEAVVTARHAAAVITALTTGAQLRGLPQPRVMVITPYEAQRSKIEECIANELEAWGTSAAGRSSGVGGEHRTLAAILSGLRGQRTGEYVTRLWGDLVVK